MMTEHGLTDIVRNGAQRLGSALTSSRRGLYSTLAAGTVGLASMGIAACDTDPVEPCVDCVDSDTTVVTTPPDTVDNSEFAISEIVRFEEITKQRLAPCEENDITMSARYNGGIPGVTDMTFELMQEDVCYYIFPKGEGESVPIGQTFKWVVTDVQGTPEAVADYIGTEYLTNVYPQDQRSYLWSVDDELHPNRAQAFEVWMPDLNVFTGDKFAAAQNCNLEFIMQAYGDEYSSCVSKHHVVPVPQNPGLLGWEDIARLDEPRVDTRTFDSREEYEAALAEIGN